ncbi:MAG: UxaA family hydrolase [Lacipirellulaceae bacterium]
MQGYLRQDGRKGIRNVVAVVYLVECAHHVAREVTLPFREQGAHLIGFPGCYPNAYAQKMMSRLCTHPNVGAVLAVSLGCESFNRSELASTVKASGRPVETLVIQETGGTRSTIEQGRQCVQRMLEQLQQTPRVELSISDLVVGTICGGSDATSGITANPATGMAFDQLVQEGAACIFEETGELVGCESHLARRAATPELATELTASVEKARRYYQTLGHGSFASGNAVGELTTQEEKSMGAYAKSGTASINGLLKPGDFPGQSGLYLLDVVPDGEVRFGFPNINDNAEIGELIACGAHVILFATGRGSVVGSAISPVIKICGNPQTYHRLEEDMDINAGAVLEGKADIAQVGREIYDCVLETAAGHATASESLGHQEFIMTYKQFEPLGPSCLPVVS